LQVLFGSAIFRAIGYIAGEIQALGPEYQQFMQSSDVQTDWKDEVDSYSSNLADASEFYLAWEKRISQYRSQDILKLQNHVSWKTCAWYTGTNRPPNEILKKAYEQYIASNSMSASQDSAQAKIFLGSHQLGLAPSAAQVGDIIVKFVGCECTLIMRTIDNMPDALILVGIADTMELEWDPAVQRDTLNLQMGLLTLQTITTNTTITSKQLEFEIMSVKSRASEKAALKWLENRFTAQPSIYKKLQGDQIRLFKILPGNGIPANEDGPNEDTIHCELSVFNLRDMVGRYEALSYASGTETSTRNIYLSATYIKSVRSYGRSSDASIVNVLNDIDQRVSQQDSRKAEDDPSRNDCAQAIAFPIHKTLHDAFRHWKSSTNRKYFWIDTVCVNQDSCSEQAKSDRRRHFAMMGAIYNSANNVRIWLGSGSQKDLFRNTFRFVRDIMDLSQLDKRLRSGDSDTREKWWGFIKCLETHWFSRRYAIQAVTLARRASVHYGYEVINWIDLERGISLLNENAEVLKAQFPESNLVRYIPALNAVALVKAIPVLCRKSNDGSIDHFYLDLETLVCCFRQYTVSAAEDVIYSVQALARDLDHGNNEVATNVAVPKTVKELFVQFVHQSILKSHCLDIICRNWAPTLLGLDTKEIKMSSWISKREERYLEGPLQTFEPQNIDSFVAMKIDDPGKKKYNASRGYEVQTDDFAVSHLMNFRNIPALVLDGMIIGRVHELSGAMESIVTNSWLEKLGWYRSQIINPQVPETVWRILVADRNPSGDPPPAWYPLACKYCLEYSRVINEDAGLILDSEQRLPETASKYLERVKSVVWRRKFLEFRHQWDGKKLFGLGPQDTRKNDLICILFGCSVPVILRRVKSGFAAHDDMALNSVLDSAKRGTQRNQVSKKSKYYQVIGGAYIHGIMDGEAVTDKDKVEESHCQLVLV
jgi:hypothetical protein